MPIYEYLCEACGAHLSLLQKMNAAAPSVCETCKAQNTLKKHISKSAFHLKGGGWYSELYASPSPSKNQDAPTPNPPPANSNAPSTSTPPSPCAGCPVACADAQKS